MRPNTGYRPVRRNPIGRAVRWREGESRRRARYRGDRARHSSFRALLKWRPDRDDERVGDGVSRFHHQARRATKVARDLFPTGLRARWGPDLLWSELDR